MCVCVSFSAIGVAQNKPRLVGDYIYADSMCRFFCDAVVPLAALVSSSVCVWLYPAGFVTADRLVGGDVGQLSNHLLRICLVLSRSVVSCRQKY